MRWMCIWLGRLHDRCSRPHDSAERWRDAAAVSGAADIVVAAVGEYRDRRQDFDGEARLATACAGDRRRPHRRGDGGGDHAPHAACSWRERGGDGDLLRHDHAECGAAGAASARRPMRRARPSGTASLRSSPACAVLATCSGIRQQHLLFFWATGAKLFQAVGRMKLREAQAIFSLRLTLEYTGATPPAVSAGWSSQELSREQRRSDRSRRRRTACRNVGVSGQADGLSDAKPLRGAGPARCE